MAIPYYSMPLSFKEAGALLKTILTFRIFHGPSIEEYKSLLREALKSKHVIPFPSGRSAFYFLIEALFQKGDEVIVSDFSFPLFIRLMHEQGIKPVFVDVEDKSALINPDLIEKAITPKTKGILITHLFGHVGSMERIVALAKKYNLFLLEDCAHAFGSQYHGQPVGSFGVAGIFSTSPMKVPTTLGGGFLSLNDQALYEKITNQLKTYPQNKYNWKKFLKVLTFSSIYWLNSYPFLFSILSSRILKHLKLKNPGALRKLFYSELVVQKVFDPFERSILTNFQARLGVFQLKRNSLMMDVQKRYASIYDSYFQNNSHIEPLQNRTGVNGCLYYIVRVKNNTDHFIDAAMDKGLFLMREDCWECNQYAFSKSYEQPCLVGRALSPQLVRLPNSSLLSEKYIHKTAQIVLEILNKDRL